MKRSIKSLILLTVLLVLIGSYGLVNKMNQQAEVAEEAGTFALTEHSVDELAGMVWNSNGTEIHFVKDENEWANADDAAFPTDQEAVQDMADRLIGMKASRKLTEVENLEDYGFGDDSFSVTVEWSNGESSRYIMGDATPFADGYYTRVDGDDRVIYTTTGSLSAMFAETLTDLAKLEEIGKVEAATALNIGDRINLTRYEESITVASDQHWYNADGEPMDDGSVESLVSDIEAMEWDTLVAVNASEEELAEYQLDLANATVISVTGDDEDMISLYIGTTDDSGAYYARLSDSNMVYTMEADAVDTVLNSTEDDLWSNVIFPLEYDDVQSFTCALNGKALLYEHADESEASDDASDDESDEDESDPSEEMWNQISALSATGRIDAEPSGDILLEISVVTTAGNRLDTSIHEYDVNSYHVITGEGRSLLVSADMIDKLIRSLKQ